MVGVTLDYSNDYIRNATSEMESLVIETIIGNVNDVSLLASKMADDFNLEKNQYQTDEAYCAAVYIMTAECFLRKLLNISFTTREEMNQLIIAPPIKPCHNP